MCLYKNNKIIQLSVVHYAFDSRIVHRETFSLSKKYCTQLLIPNPSKTKYSNIDLLEVPFFKRLTDRILKVHPIIILKCLRIYPKIVHFHDAELIPVALILRIFGIKIIYDIHDNIYKQWSAKTMNNAAIFRFFFSIFDRLARRYFYLIFAEKSYLATYHDLAKPHEVILNYPNLEFFEPFYQARIGKTPQRTIFYIGQLSMARGIDTLIKAVALLRPEYPDLQVHLVGGFEFDIRSKQDLYQIENYEETKENLVFHGKMDARLGLRFATEAAVGVALLKSVGDFPESYPTKIFEYMALGMPVITSDFPLYRPIVQGNQAGFCIDPTNAVALAQAFRWIMEHPEQAQAMGQRGREAVKKYYNWQSEEAKLFRLYEQILGT